MIASRRRVATAMLDADIAAPAVTGNSFPFVSPKYRDPIPPG